MSGEETPSAQDTGEFHEATFVQFASLAELGLLTASLIHELRQPLMAAKGLMQLGAMQADGLRGVQLREALAAVEQIEDLVDYYGGAGSIGGPKGVYDLNQPIEQAVRMLAHRSKRLGNPVELELAPGPLPVEGHAFATRQILLNLLQNALDAVQDSDPRRIRVWTETGHNVVRFWVEDNGGGVPEALREEIFEPFVTTKAPGKGTGLGLYIVKRLVLQEDGELAVSYPEAGGTLMQVTLPGA